MTTYEHTLPSGDTVTFTVTQRGPNLVVSYDEGIDLSAYSARDAYPTEAIEADHGTFRQCLAHGCDHGTAWELWQVR